MYHSFCDTWTRRATKLNSHTWVWWKNTNNKHDDMGVRVLQASQTHSIWMGLNIAWLLWSSQQGNEPSQHPVLLQHQELQLITLSISICLEEWNLTMIHRCQRVTQFCQALPYVRTATEYTNTKIQWNCTPSIGLSQIIQIHFPHMIDLSKNKHGFTQYMDAYCVLQPLYVWKQLHVFWGNKINFLAYQPKWLVHE